MANSFSWLLGMGCAISATNQPIAGMPGFNKHPSILPIGFLRRPGPSFTRWSRVVGWRTYLRDDTTALPMQLWLAQMILNFIWSPVFFTLHYTALALAIILTLVSYLGGRRPDRGGSGR